MQIISVVVIAHNEEAWITHCLDALMAQTQKPDEIIVVAHNCADRTAQIAQSYPVQIIECTGGGGPIFARMKGIEAATGEFIVCTDGDAWTDKNWIKEIIKPLANPKVAIVAGYTTICNSFGWRFACWWQFYIKRKLFNIKKHQFAWGSNMAFRKSDYEKVDGLKPFLDAYQKLGVQLFAEDLYISLVLQKLGKFTTALGARVYTYLPKEKACMGAQKRIVPIQRKDNRIIRDFLGTR